MTMSTILKYTTICNSHVQQLGARRTDLRVDLLELLHCLWVLGLAKLFRLMAIAAVATGCVTAKPTETEAGEATAASPAPAFGR